MKVNGREYRKPRKANKWQRATDKAFVATFFHGRRIPKVLKSRIKTVSTFADLLDI
jgi:hypothetical protein